MGRFFGTDGIRGRAGEPPLDPPTVQRIGRALVRAMGGGKLRVLLGRDTRESSPWLESHIAAGLCWEGAEVVSAGVIPTPAVAHLARREGFDLGVVLSASHNPYEDNGIKVFGGGGRKFTTEMEAVAEDLIESLPDLTTPPLSAPFQDFSEGYLRHLARTLPVPSLAGMRLVVDCANGATSFLARRLFEALGASVDVLNDAPDGKNINRFCGATHIDEVAAAVVARGADIGIAFDGDGDRAMFADATGGMVTGDHVLFLAARHLKAQGRLKGDSVVATVMSNLGLEHALGTLGIGLVRAAVGDRNVLDEMERLGANLGGEQSGHVIFLDYEPTGDGLLTALQVLGIVRESGRALHDLAGDLTVYPQVLMNVRVRDRVEIDAVPGLRDAVERARAALDGRGRVLVRYSGTEPLLRVMAEGPDEAEVRSLATAIVAAAADTIGTEASGAR